MNESWNALGHLVCYMDARWKRDTLEALLKCSHLMLDLEVKHLIFADLLYLDPEKYKRIVGGVGHEVARRQLTKEYVLEVRRMDNSRQKLMRHNLVAVDTMGQLKTVAQLKRDYDWDVEVVIECDSEEVKRQMQEVATNSLITIQEPEVATNHLIAIREARKMIQSCHSEESPEKITFDDMQVVQDESLPIREASVKIQSCDSEESPEKITFDDMQVVQDEALPIRGASIKIQSCDSEESPEKITFDDMQVVQDESLPIREASVKIQCCDLEESPEKITFDDMQVVQDEALPIRGASIKIRSCDSEELPEKITFDDMQVVQDESLPPCCWSKENTAMEEDDEDVEWEE